MQVFFELLFSLSYIAIISYIGFSIYKSSKQKEDKHLSYSMFLNAIIFTLYLIPKLINIIFNNQTWTKVVGYIYIIKEIYISIFLLYLFIILFNRYSLKRDTLKYTVYSLSALRIITILFMGNIFTNNKSTILTVLSIIPFVFLGTLLVLLYKQKSEIRNDKILKFFWVILAIFVSTSVIECIFYKVPFIIYPNLLSIFAIYWILFKDFSLKKYEDKKYKI